MEKRDDFYIPDETAEWIGLKKSEYLSKLIELQGPDDIGFEDFLQYDSFVIGTIEGPDKTYEFEDDRQRIRSYVKTYAEKGGFHQVVVGVMLNDQDKAWVFVPILTFVTKDEKLVKEFGKGEVILAPTLN